MPIVTRFNHSDGIALYNRFVAVTAKSGAVSAAEHSQDLAYNRVPRECEQVAVLLKATASIRIDIRRFKGGSDFALFDVNMKPVSLQSICNAREAPTAMLEYYWPGKTWQIRPGQPDSDGSGSA